jgi:hypothetical protein
MCGMGGKDGLHKFASEIVDVVQEVHQRFERIVATLESHEIGLINADMGLHNVVWHEGRAGLVDFLRCMCRTLRVLSRTLDGKDPADGEGAVAGRRTSERLP